MECLIRFEGRHLSSLKCFRHAEDWVDGFDTIRVVPKERETGDTKQGMEWINLTMEDEECGIKMMMIVMIILIVIVIIIIVIIIL